MVGNWIDSLAGLLSPLNKIIDEFVETDEEKAKAKTMLKTALDGEMRARFEDMASARAREIAVNTSPNATWLTKNTGSLLAWIIVASTFSLDAFVIFKGIDATAMANKDVLMFVLGALNTYTAGVINFYFGSSKDQSDHLKTIK